MQVEGPELSPGTATKARVLDVSKDTGIVDVSLKPALVEAAAAAAPTASSTRESAADEESKKGSKKRKAAEALDAAHASGLPLKVATVMMLNLNSLSCLCLGCAEVRYVMNYCFVALS